jgi:hypothetical protein
VAIDFRFPATCPRKLHFRFPGSRRVVRVLRSSASPFDALLGGDVSLRRFAESSDDAACVAEKIF